jgi:hypothetical protein
MAHDHRERNGAVYAATAPERLAATASCRLTLRRSPARTESIRAQAGERSKTAPKLMSEPVTTGR